MIWHAFCRMLQNAASLLRYFLTLAPIFPANCGLHSGRSSLSRSFGTKDAYEKAASEQKTWDRKEWRPKSLASDHKSTSMTSWLNRSGKTRKDPANIIERPNCILIFQGTLWVKTRITACPSQANRASRIPCLDEFGELFRKSVACFTPSQVSLRIWLDLTQDDASLEPRNPRLL